MRSEILLTLFLIWFRKQGSCVSSFYPTCQSVPVSLCSKDATEIKTAKLFGGKIKTQLSVDELNVKQWMYNATVYPSFADDKSDVDAILKLNYLHPLISTKCSPFIKVFLCSVHSPVCTIHGVVPPCRELCERVRNDCSHVAQIFDLDWPEVSNCEVFPSYNPNFECSSNEAKDDALLKGNENILVSRITPITWGEVLLANGNVSVLFCLSRVYRSIIAMRYGQELNFL